MNAKPDTVKQVNISQIIDIHARIDKSFKDPDKLFKFPLTPLERSLEANVINKYENKFLPQNIFKTYLQGHKVLDSWVTGSDL